MASQQQDIVAFLEDAFQSIQRPTDSAVGRVTVEPVFSVVADEIERAELASELQRCILEATARTINLESPQGHDIQFSGPRLTKYLRTITFYGAPIIDPWIQVLPSGGNY